MKILEELYLGKGVAKVVYRHPSDPTICIKFPKKKKKRALHDILREISYLKKHQDKLPWLSRYIGEIESDRGRGFMYQVALHEDGSPAENLWQLDHAKYKSELEQKVSAMYTQLIREHAVVNDLNLRNIYVSNKHNGDFDLILVDGFGNNNFIKIADYSKFFLIQKLNRKFTNLCNQLNIPSSFLHKKQ